MELKCGGTYTKDNIRRSENERESLTWLGLGIMLRHLGDEREMGVSCFDVSWLAFSPRYWGCTRDVLGLRWTGRGWCGGKAKSFPSQGGGTEGLIVFERLMTWRLFLSLLVSCF